MHNKFTRNFFLTVSLSLAVSSAHAMESDNLDESKGIQPVKAFSSQSIRAKDSPWIISYRQPLGEYSRTMCLSYTPDMKLNQIEIGEYADGRGFFVDYLPYCVYVESTKQSEFKTTFSAINAGLSLNNIKFRHVKETYSYSINLSDTTECGKFFSILHMQKLVPDHAMDRIIRFTGMEDFRK